MRWEMQSGHRYWGIVVVRPCALFPVAHFASRLEALMVIFDQSLQLDKAFVPKSRGGPVC